jgi:hypothetical protein
MCVAVGVAWSQETKTEGQKSLEGCVERVKKAWAVEPVKKDVFKVTDRSGYWLLNLDNCLITERTEILAYVHQIEQGSNETTEEEEETNDHDSDYEDEWRSESKDDEDDAGYYDTVKNKVTSMFTSTPNEPREDVHDSEWAKRKQIMDKLDNAFKTKDEEAFERYTSQLNKDASADEPLYVLGYQTGTTGHNAVIGRVKSYNLDDAYVMPLDFKTSLDDDNYMMPIEHMPDGRTFMYAYGLRDVPEMWGPTERFTDITKLSDFVALRRVKGSKEPLDVLAPENRPDKHGCQDWASVSKTYSATPQTIYAATVVMKGFCPRSMLREGNIMVSGIRKVRKILGGREHTIYKEVWRVWIEKRHTKLHWKKRAHCTPAESAKMNTVKQLFQNLGFH